MGCGASATSNVKAAVAKDALIVEPVKAVQGATAASDVVTQGTPVAKKNAEDAVVAPSFTPAEQSDAEIERKLRIIEGLSKAAIAVAGKNPGAAAGLATAAASLVEDIPADTEGLDPKIAKGLA